MGGSQTYPLLNAMDSQFDNASFSKANSIYGAKLCFSREEMASIERIPDVKVGYYIHVYAEERERERERVRL